MYIIEFFKRIMRKSNIPVIIYLVLNYFVIAAVIYFFNYDVLQAFLIGAAVYVVSLVIALSPIGEWILRVQLGCKKIKRQDHMDYLYPLFAEVYEKARQLDPSLATDIELYINNDAVPNAFATGRKTICVTKGLMEMPPEQIKATLGHEFGHLSHKDTDLILVVTVGNMIVNAIIMGVKIIIELIHILFLIIAFFVGGEHSLLGTIFIEIYHLLVILFVNGLTWLWSKLGVLLVMKSSRGNEYEADEFSVKLGYGEELCALLDNICGESPKGLFANLVSSHPDTDDRIARIQAMGASYNLYNGNLALEMDKEKDVITPQIETDQQPQLESVPSNDVITTLQASIKCIAGEFAGAEFPLVENEAIVVGKDATLAQIVLMDRYISGKHCSIMYDEDKDIFVVTDTSTNGTYLENCNRLEKNVCKFLPNNTLLVLGDGRNQFKLTVTKTTSLKKEEVKQVVNRELNKQCSGLGHSDWFCTNCGKKHSNEFIYCTNCGKKNN